MKFGPKKLTFIYFSRIDFKEFHVIVISWDLENVGFFRGADNFL